MPVCEDNGWTGMTEILLTHCNHIFFDGKQARKMQPYPPLQTLIAAACLRADGFQVALFDATFEPPEEGFRQALARHKPRSSVSRYRPWFLCALILRRAGYRVVFEVQGNPIEAARLLI